MNDKGKSAPLTPDIQRELTVMMASLVAVTLVTDTPIHEMGYRLGIDGITTDTPDGSAIISIDTPLGPVELTISVKVKE